MSSSSSSAMECTPALVGCMVPRRLKLLLSVLNVEPAWSACLKEDRYGAAC